MQYEQVILFVVFCLTIYYLVMIVMDLQKAKAAKQAEAENNKEEDIDISDEAKQFCPVKITREIKPKQAETQTEEKTDGQQAEQKTSKGEDLKAAKAANNSNITENTENGNKAENNGNKPEKATDEMPQNHPQPNSDAQKANSQPNEPKNDDVPSEEEEQKPQRILRKAIMTDGIEAEKLAEYAEAGILEEKLGPVVRNCENAMINIE